MHKTIAALSLALLTACGGGGGGSSSAPVAAAPPPPSQDTPTPSPVEEDTTTVQLLGVVTPGVADLFADVDLRVQHLVSVANDVLAHSDVRLRFEMTHLEVVGYPDEIDIETALDDLTFARHPELNHIADLRANVQADLVVLFRPYANDGHCGFAWLGGFGTQGDLSNPAERDYGYSVVAANCSDYTLLHELGHNMGLAHSRDETLGAGTFTWARGHGEMNDFVTIMASPAQFNAVRLPRMSSPVLECNGKACGVDGEDEVRGADAVRALGVVKGQVAGYY